MRADRLIDLVALLRRHERLSAGELATRLAVSRRTVLRDLDALSLSGVPVFATRGRGGGYSILAGYRPETAGLTTAESQALFLPGGEPAADAVGQGEVYRAARRKLEAVLSDEAARQVGDVSRWLLVAPEGWGRPTPPPQSLPALAAAAARHEIIEIAYRAIGQRTSARRVRPAGLVCAGRTWYLVAARDDSGELRTYRAERVRRVTPTGRVFEPQLDLATSWQRARESFRERPGVEVLLRTSEEALPVVDYLMSIAGRRTGTRALGHGRYELSGVAERLPVAAALFAGLGERAEVVHPPDLIDAIVSLSQYNIRAYGHESEAASSSRATSSSVVGVKSR